MNICFRTEGDSRAGQFYEDTNMLVPPMISFLGSTQYVIVGGSTQYVGGSTQHVGGSTQYVGGIPQGDPLNLEYCPHNERYQMS